MRLDLAAGDGGESTRRLVADLFLQADHAPLEDAADIAGDLVFSIDAFVVDPFEFPGGNIGELAVFGTANDLAMRGAIPKYLTASWVLPEGFEMKVLKKLAASMLRAARSSGITIVGGDTKVLPEADLRGPIVTTAGIGAVLFDSRVSNVSCGDSIILTGPVGDHAAAILATREGIVLENPPVSDCRSLWPIVCAAFEAGAHFSRDVTRGGLRQVLYEVARSGPHDIELTREVPLHAFVTELCDLIGASALDFACEGTAILAVPSHLESEVLQAIRAQDGGSEAAVIGKVSEGEGRVRRSSDGQVVFVSPEGEGIPRIC